MINEINTSLYKADVHNIFHVRELGFVELHKLDIFKILNIGLIFFSEKQQDCGRSFDACYNIFSYGNHLIIIFIVLQTKNRGKLLIKIRILIKIQIFLK